MVSRAKVWSENEHRLFRANLQDVADNPEGRVDCLSSFLLEHREFGLEYDEIAYNVRRRTLPVRPDERADGNHASGAPRDLVSPSLSGQAGSHTSLSAIQFGLMAAAVFPDAQQLVQAELDRVVGRNRSTPSRLPGRQLMLAVPTFADMDKLPITLAYSREVQRWRPVSSGGFQHATTADLTWVRRLALSVRLIVCRRAQSSPRARRSSAITVRARLWPDCVDGSQGRSAATRPPGRTRTASTLRAS